MSRSTFTFLFLCAALSCSDMKSTDPIYLSSIMAENYPSGSTISYLSNRFYVMGDDAAEILMLDTKMGEMGRIQIFAKGESARLPKLYKADIEASAVITNGSNDAILFLGSGSLSPHRDSAFLLDPLTKNVKRIDMKRLYDSLRKEFKDLNIEAATSIGDQLLLGIRANSTYPDNYLVFAGAGKDFYGYQNKLKLKLPVVNVGISGMDYDEARDILFVTFSTEETSNSFDDGRIGNSYLGVISDAARLSKKEVLVIDSLINLNDLHQEFAGQKIESVSLTAQQGTLLLVADDDRGTTKFFTIRL